MTKGRRSIPPDEMKRLILIPLQAQRNGCYQKSLDKDCSETDKLAINWWINVMDLMIETLEEMFRIGGEKVKKQYVLHIFEQARSSIFRESVSKSRLPEAKDAFYFFGTILDEMTQLVEKVFEQ